jgi:uncharacterized protein
MGKLFLFILFGVVVYFMLKRQQRPLSNRSAAPPPVAEPMVQCARCRIHIPLSDSLANGDQRYCCEEHRRLGRG